MARAAGGPDAWLETQVCNLLRHYREADAIDDETAATVERYIEDGATEAALRELVDGR